MNIKYKSKLLIAVLCAFTFSGCIAGSANNKLDINPDIKNQLPAIITSDLNGKDYNLPKDFPKKYNLVAFGFAHAQKELTVSWAEPAAELQKTFSNLAFFKIPVIDNSNAALRLMIRNGMRSKSDDYARLITLTLFTEKEKFIEAIEVSDQEPAIILLDQTGKILWKEKGAADSKKTADIQKLLAKLSKMKNAGP